MISTSIVLFIGGIIADYIFPHIRPIERFIRSLPLGGGEP